MSAVLESNLVKTLTRHGNSLALVIDKPILDMLGISADTPLQITTDGKSIFVSPVDVDRHAKFRAAAEETFRRYPNMLKRLAQ
jgi:antitoxin component of MazEF toxin-antitoxin module